MNPYWRTGLCRWLVACACVLALAAIGCFRGEERTSSRASTVIVAYPYGENGMNPVDDEISKFLVFLPLLAENEKGELEGRLAERWEHSPDYREWTFHLRPGVRWHDGAAVTAQDVKFTLELLAHPDVGEFGPGYIESVTVPDDSTVTVRYGNAYASGALTWEVCFPKHLLEHLDAKKVTEW
ncbi:MAG: ABC transporter substrate-binding protein, partial [bacterium]